MEASRIDRLSSIFLSKSLPRNLKKFIEIYGFDSSRFGEDHLWRLHSKAYKPIKQMNPTPAFYEICTILLAYIEAKVGLLVMPAGKNSPVTRRTIKYSSRKKSSQRAPQKMASDLKRAHPDIRTQISDRRSAPVIGLGLKTMLSQPPRARREDVIIDAHTAGPDRSDPYHAIYVAGWSLAESDKSS